ncbi:asparagine synthase-related protein [Sphingobium cupriresistens]|uniref:asparagine synthase-related protein n=1 Tax=Sphingobium cupriresistens TaxID=1132417 RepID=UPI003BAE0A47
MSSSYSFAINIGPLAQPSPDAGAGGVGIAPLPFSLITLNSDLDRYEAADDRGRHLLVVGNVFDRIANRIVSPDDFPVILREEDPVHALLTDYWGRYVAVLHDARNGQVELVRDPSGQLPCYYRQHSGQLLVAHDADQLFSAAAAADPDWSILARHLRNPMVRTNETCLQGVSELLPGLSVTWSQGAAACKPRWVPRIEADLIDKSVEAIADRLKREIENAVSAWARRFPRPLLGLSGGLDSSVIAASLRARKADVNCLNAVSGTGRGDERSYAAAVAAMHGFPLHEAVLEVHDIDYSRSLASTKPRPSSSAFTQAIDKASADVAEACSAEAHFSGGGGDNIFAFIHSSYPATDCLLDTGFGAKYRSTISNLTRMTGCDMWQIMARSIRHGVFAHRPFVHRVDERFLGEKTAEALPVHPWIVRGGKRRPGKRQHIAATLEAIHFTEFLNIGGRPTIYPLLSQPLMEYCLSIPVWRWSHNGIDRSLVREAFRRLLPEEIIARRTKGSFGQLFEAGFMRNIEVIRSMLADGQLAAQGLLDRAACLDALSVPERLRPEVISRLALFVDAEAWLAGRSRH